MSVSEAGWSEVSAPMSHAFTPASSSSSSSSSFSSSSSAAAALVPSSASAASASASVPSATSATSAPSAASSASSNGAASSSMSLVRALDEVALLDKRIAKKIADASFIGLASKKNRQTLNPDEFGRAAKADWQAVTDLIRRRAQIKSAVIRSNAVTMVRVHGEDLTVAEVIERKKSLDLQRNLLTKLRTSREQVTRAVEQHNASMDGELQKLLEIHFGKSNGGKTNASDIEDISRPFRESNSARMLDPIAIDSKIRELEAYVEQFEREAKFTLSESNAITRIHI